MYQHTFSRVFWGMFCVLLSVTMFADIGYSQPYIVLGAGGPSGLFGADIYGAPFSEPKFTGEGPTHWVRGIRNVGQETGPSMGLNPMPLPGVQVNAISFGQDSGSLYLFSVSPVSQGLSGTGVWVEFNTGTAPSQVYPGPPAGNAPPEAMGDVFTHFGVPFLPDFPFFPNEHETIEGAGNNWIFGSGIFPGDEFMFGLNVSDNIAGLEYDSPLEIGTTRIYFTISRNSTHANPPFSSADILCSDLSGEYPVVWATAAQLGLDPQDEINALMVYAHGDEFVPFVDSVVFSLASGSPTLDALGASAADLFTYDGNDDDTRADLIVKAEALGLRTDDDITALDVISSLNTPTPTITPTTDPTDTPTPTETPTDTPTPTHTDTPTEVVPTDTPLPTNTPETTPPLETYTPTITPEQPTDTPTALPTETPTMEPTSTRTPTMTPTSTPTMPPGCLLVSVNRPVTASSSYPTGQFPPEKAVDGQIGGEFDRWISDFGFSHWLLVDLQDVYLICEIWLYGDEAFVDPPGTGSILWNPTHYIIRGSIDGGGDPLQWPEIASYHNPCGPPYADYPGEGVNAHSRHVVVGSYRYVLLHILGADGECGPITRVQEFKIFGQLVPTRTPTATVVATDTPLPFDTPTATFTPQEPTATPIIETPTPVLTGFPTASNPASDINGDGIVDVRDMLMLLRDWHHIVPENQ